MTHTTASDAIVYPQDDGTGLTNGSTDIMSGELIGQHAQVIGVGTVTNAQHDVSLLFGDVTSVSATVTEKSDYRSDFETVFDGSETFDIDWLTFDFDSNRGV